MTAERAIHVAIFVLAVIGLSSISAWVCYTFLDQLILQIAGIALSWGTILLVLYVSFKRLEWDWWRQKETEPGQKQLVQKQS